MNDKVLAVINGFESLNEEERKQFIEDINKLLQGKRALRKSVIANESFTISLGPLQGGCPCCGR